MQYGKVHRGLWRGLEVAVKIVLVSAAQVGSNFSHLIWHVVCGIKVAFAHVRSYEE